MDRLFIDTNVLLDVLESRPAFVTDSLRVIALAKSHQARAAVSPLSLSDITYILRKSEQNRVLEFFLELRQAVEIAGLGEAETDHALAAGMADFEDALQWQAAQSWKASHFITRNTSDFPSDQGIVVASPSEYLDS
jgi:predicted nucleic acid-binding protein